MPTPPPYLTRYASVQQKVRAYRPSMLLPALAAYAATPIGDPRSLADRAPWAVAALAKESIVRGNEYRPATVPPDVAERLVHAFNNAFDLPAGDFDLPELMIPIAYEQFPYQETNFTDLARTQALFLETELPSSAGPSVAQWEDALGVPLGMASQAIFTLFVWASQNQGRIDLTLLDAPQLQPLLERVPRHAIEACADRMTATVDQAKADYAKQPKLERRLERFAYNPLVATPMINLGSQGIVSPQPALILGGATPSSLYYVGAERWGNRFLQQLGLQFEAYVGRHLELIEGAITHPEVVYGKSQKKSIDWFVVLPNLVLLVECKLGRPVLEARAGAATLVERYVEKLDPARKQINETADRIRQGDPAFDFVPTDRPVVGLVVTYEQFYMANDESIAQHMRSATIPTLYASVKDIEQLVTLPTGRLSEVILELVKAPTRSAVSVTNALPGEELGRNSLMDAAWRNLNYLAEAAAPLG